MADDKAVALLFLTVDEICNCDVWEAWLRDANPEHFTIYVHAKVPYRRPRSCGIPAC